MAVLADAVSAQSLVTVHWRGSRLFFAAASFPFGFSRTRNLCDAAFLRPLHATCINTFLNRSSSPPLFLLIDLDSSARPNAMFYADCITRIPCREITRSRIFNEQNVHELIDQSSTEMIHALARKATVATKRLKSVASSDTRAIGKFYYLR